MMGVGEQMERAQRRKFWTSLGVIGAAGIPLGFMIGYNAGHDKVGLAEAASKLPPTVLALCALAYAISITVGSYVFVRNIDEVELADNLWGSTAAYYAYAVLFPCWWLLATGGFVSEPQDWTIFIVALACGLVAYGWRKWRVR